VPVADRKESARLVQPFQLVQPAVLELDAGTGDEVTHRRGVESGPRVITTTASASLLTASCRLRPQPWHAPPTRAI
jgi:hypothetical protein